MYYDYYTVLYVSFNAMRLIRHHQQANGAIVASRFFPWPTLGLLAHHGLVHSCSSACIRSLEPFRDCVFPSLVNEVPIKTCGVDVCLCDI
jgi:hypothetical protein